MGIPLLDHVIVGGDNSSYFSLREKEMLEKPHFEDFTDYRGFSFENLVAEENDCMKGKIKVTGKKGRILRRRECGRISLRREKSLTDWAEARSVRSFNNMIVRVLINSKIYFDFCKKYDILNKE